MIADQIHIIKDISLLYELSLSVGTSLDIQKNCENFLQTLIPRKNFTYASVWVYGSFINETEQNRYYLLYAYPEFRVQSKVMTTDHPVVKALAGKQYMSINHADPRFPEFVQEIEVHKGAYAIFRLGDLGFLKLHTLKQEEVFEEKELNQLVNVLNKFTISLAACLSHQKYKEILSRQRKTMQDLEESKEKYKNVVENLDEGLILTDKEDRIVYVNGRLAEMVGYSPEEMMGKVSNEVFVPKADRPLFRQRHEERIAGKSERYESRMLRKDGSDWWASINASPYRNSRGEIVGSVGAVNNITEQKRVQKAMQENDAKIRAIIDSSLDAVLVIDQQGMVNEWNAHAEIVFGWTRDEVKGRRLSDTIIPHRYREAHESGMKKFLSTGEGPVLNNRIEISAINRDGREFPIELTICPIRLEGIYFFSAFIRDISERKEAEARKEKLLKQLAQANADLKDFAYVVSHDLKAPLRAISSLAQWIEEDYEDKFDENGKEQLRLLRGRVSRMSDLISGILDYSRVGRLNTQIQEVETQKVVNQIMDLLSPGNSISMEIHGPLPKVYYNKVSLQQVFQNLISNAIKYNDKPHGHLEVGYKADSEYFTFWVKDDGPGIDEKYHQKIFKIFQTLRPRDEREATGVGLSIVKKIVQLFGGEIWVESVPAQGSTFYFSVPKTPKKINTELV